MFYMLSFSEFGWDNEKMMIICKNDAFDEYAKVKFLKMTICLQIVHSFLLLDFMLLTHCIN